MIVLDSSAVIAIIRREPGASTVIEHCPGAWMSSVNLAEVIAVALRLGLDHRQTEEQLARLRFGIAPFTRAQAIRTGVLEAPTRALGLSLGDRACLALAEELNGYVLTTDRRMSQSSLGIEIRLVR